MYINRLPTTSIFRSNEKKHRQALTVFLTFLTISVLGIGLLILITYSLPGISSTENVQVLMLLLVAFICYLGMNFTNRMIADRSQAQATNLEIILNNITDGVLVRNQQRKFVSANPALLKMIPEAELKQISASTFEKTLRWKRKFFMTTTVEMPEIGSVVIFRDQTRCRETEQARDALLATVSHEFRTPLTATMNYLEMLLVLTKMKKIDGDAFIAHLTRALENSHRLQHLVDHIIEQAQLQAGAVKIKSERFNLPELLQKSSQLPCASLKQNNVRYELHIAPNVPMEIKGDSKRLHQALSLVLDNAIKFTELGTVKVRVSMESSNKLAIEVADTGIGIPEEQLPDIFEAFRRASNYTEREYQGAGLGLSIARQLITSMGGKITVTSTLGTGSTFTISLPINIVC
jgi:signal transduction histidine kinase